MTKFSSVFQLNKTQSQLDFVDIDLHADTPLYIDPYALIARDDTWSEHCHAMVVSFFTAVLDAVRSKDHHRGARLLGHLGEPEETRLGVSTGQNKGRGIGAGQAKELFDAMANSAAARSGLLEDLSDFALFVPNIGRDKISDMTTNIIRLALIHYTQNQCKLLDIPMRRVGSGMYWDSGTLSWNQEYVELPVFEDRKILLVPKYTVRWQVNVDHTDFRSKFVLEFLKAEHLRADDSLVTTLRDKNGRVTEKKVYKGTVDKHYPKHKEFLAEFSIAHPEVIDSYRDSLKLSSTRIPNLSSDRLTESDLAHHLAAQLDALPAGIKHADAYHKLMIGIVSFLLFPNLIYPKREAPINDGRKRIDITYTNGKDSGFFQRIAFDQNVKANIVHVECKNYNDDIANPEFDQLIGRFDHNRGKLGLLFYRSSKKPETVIKRAKDAAKSNLGIVFPMDDEFVLWALTAIANNNRVSIDQRIDALYRELIS